MTAGRAPGAERVYALFLRVYPPSFRTRFEAGMRHAFLEDHRNLREGGVFARAAFWFITAVQALWFGLAERRARRHVFVPPGGPMRSWFTLDWRDALRSLRATPIVTAVAVASLALGIGANTALFSILDSLILKTLPVREPSQLVVIDDGSWTNPIWEEIRSQRHEIFDDAFAWNGTNFDLSTHGETDNVQGAWASGGMYDVLGVHAILGRTFTDADDTRAGGADGPVAVISYGFWQRRFGGAPDIVGRHLTVNRVPVVIIGVTPEGFLGPDVGRSADVVVPIGVQALVPGNNGKDVLGGRSTWWLEIMARLKPGQTIDQATAALRAAQPAIRLATIPEDWPGPERAQYLTPPFTLVPAATGESDLRSTYQQPLEIIMVVVGAVLLIACANIANLLLARASARRRELSLRLALGASRLRLARQLLLESVLLAGAGAALGLGIAKWGGALLVRQLATRGAGVTLDLSIDWRVLAFTAGIALLTALVFGLAPALGVSRVAPNEALKEQGRGVMGDRRFGLKNVLVIGQVALSLSLVVGAALFLRTFSALTHASLGFDTHGVLTASLDTRAIQVDRLGRQALFDRLRDAAAGMPGVSSAALSVIVPMGNAGWNTRIESPSDGLNLSPRQRIPWVNCVSPGWFATFGMRMLDGRDIDAHDTAGAVRVAVVNESFARRFFPGVRAVGREFRAGLEGPTINTFQIVGVVNDSVYRSVRTGVEPTLYAPLAQLSERPQTNAVLSVRAAGGSVPVGLAHTLGERISSVDPAIAFSIRPLSEQVGGSVGQERLVAMLGGFFGALALLLAALGLYGVTSYSVNRRRAEIGIRMALGANAPGVVRLVLGRVVWLVGAGVAAGAALSLWASHFVTKMLFGLGPRDPLTFTLAALVLVVAGLVAGWLPARRASRIDPVQVLRES